MGDRWVLKKPLLADTFMSATRKAATHWLLLYVHSFTGTFVAAFATIQRRNSEVVQLCVPEPWISAALYNGTKQVYFYLSLAVWGFMGVWPMRRVPLVKCFSAWSSPLQAFSATSLFVFRRLILKWSRSVVHVQLRSSRALALAKFLCSKRLKVETNFTDTLKCSVICSAVRCSKFSLLSGCFILHSALLFSLKKIMKRKPFNSLQPPEAEVSVVTVLLQCYYCAVCVWDE